MLRLVGVRRVWCCACVALGFLRRAVRRSVVLGPVVLFLLPVLSRAVLCCCVLCCFLGCCSLPFRAAPYSCGLCGTPPRCVLLFGVAVLRCALVLFSAALCHVVLCRAVLCCLFRCGSSVSSCLIWCFGKLLLSPFGAVLCCSAVLPAMCCAVSLCAGFRGVSYAVLCWAVLPYLRGFFLCGAILPLWCWLVPCGAACFLWVIAVMYGCPLLSPGGMFSCRCP